MLGGLVNRLRVEALEKASTSLGQCSVGAPTATPLELALRRVTHTDCAVVPSEAIEEVVSAASETEHALALVLRHVEENACAPAKEWRRIKGSLALLEKMLRPGLNGEALVGRMWYEGKMEKRLKTLVSFHHEEDPRVAGLIKHAATATLRAAELFIPQLPEENSPEPGGGESGSEDACTGDGPRRNTSGDGGEHETTLGGDLAGTGGSGSAKSAGRTSSELRRLNSPTETHLSKSPDQPSSPSLPSAATIGRTNSGGRSKDILDSKGGIDDVEAAMAATRVKIADLRIAELDAVPGVRHGSHGKPPVASGDATPISREESRPFCCCCRRRNSAGDPSENEDDHLL